MSEKLALITGSTGFIGSQVALQTLKAGYRLRLVVRREDQATKLRRILASYENRLEFAIIPDLTVPGAFDAHLQDVQYILHLASPLAKPGARAEELLTPAVQGTVSVLESAAKSPSVKKVVITASVLSLVSLGAIRDGTTIRETDDVDYTIDPEVLPALDPMGQYHASKLAAHKATLDFVANHQPAFDIVTIHPVFVFGRNLVQESAGELAGTNGMLFQSLMSEKPSMGQYLGVHVEDVAEAHVKALDEGAKGLRAYLLGAKRRSWAEVGEFVREKYPGLEVKVKPVDSVDWTVDAGRAERELGMVFRGMEEQVSDVVEQQVGLRGKI